MTVDELIDEINAKCEGKPFRKLPLPKDISKRINFQ
jgi:threonyl-tRNA synthetase